jgi:hypothetical protein
MALASTMSFTSALASRAGANPTLMATLSIQFPCLGQPRLGRTCPAPLWRTGHAGAAFSPG